VRLSEEGQTLLAGIQQQRTEWFRELMGDWTAEEASDFAGHLERFGADLERSREQMLARRTTAPAPTATSPSTDPSPTLNPEN
jgi:DNA-binding MarR family transcriptional regulator